MQSAYGDVDLDEEPVIVPECGHIMTLSSLDGHMGMGEFYHLSETKSVIGLRTMPKPLTADVLKVCPACRGPLRTINRYNRIVRQQLLEQSTKRFITWANRRFLPLQERFFDEEEQLQDGIDAFMADILRAPKASVAAQQQHPRQLSLKKHPRDQLSALLKYSMLKERYTSIVQLRSDIQRCVQEVSEEEQPFGRVFDMVCDVRRRRGIEATMQLDRSVLNTRNRLLAASLAIRCDLAILSDFLTLRRKGNTSPSEANWIRAELSIDLSENRKACEELLAESLLRVQPIQMVEAQISHARWSHLEQVGAASSSEHTQMLWTSALEYLTAAEATCKNYPGSTRGVGAQIEDVRRMVHGGVFYSIVDNEEKRQIYSAMAREFGGGSGHWYRCTNGHPFTIGECGGPMQTSRCPQCGAPVGGSHHQPAAGVTRDVEFERPFQDMRLGP